MVLVCHGYIHVNIYFFIDFQILTKNWAERLGCTARGVQSIMGHPFLRDIDWKKLEARQIEPPLKPEQVGGKTCWREIIKYLLSLCQKTWQNTIDFFKTPLKVGYT